ncbi:helix-turn-helix domain-containing protein, partial [Amycolatopsis ultiminotia]|uniref:TetR/AcrR family transcriptional regulator n=1 Tax=Amycolatopsis ultiminotia TaxID=543629 RepID=UPI0031E8D5BE
MTPMSDAAYPTDVRAALLASARAELLAHGPGGLSLRAIAARAGVSRATPKWHFGNRAGLLTALAIEGFAQLGDALVAAVRGLTDPAARFTAVGRAYLAFGLGNPELFDLMFRATELDR